MKIEIVKIESGMIECPVVNDQRYVAIKPVCEMLGIDVEGQRQMLKNHPIFSSSTEIISAVGSDGRQREMTCIKLRRFFGWILTIHPEKVKEGNRANLIKYQELISDVLYEKFVEEPEFYKLKNEQKGQLLEQLNEVNESREKLKKQLKTIEDLTWDDFKANNRQLKIDFAS